MKFTAARAPQFYRWHGELEAARTAEAEGKFREYAAALGGHLATCDALLALVHPVFEATDVITVVAIYSPGTVRIWALMDSRQRSRTCWPA